MGKRGSKEFKRGYLESNTNVRDAKVISAMYVRSKEMSDYYGRDIPETEKGYVIGVADRLMSRWNGYALRGAELYLSTGFLDSEKEKKAVFDKLVKDVARSKSANYLKEVKSFMKSNGLEESVKGTDFEKAVSNAGKKIVRVVPIFVIGLGVLLSTFKITGAAVGAPGIISVLGSGVFLAGIVLTAISMELKKF